MRSEKNADESLSGADAAPTTRGSRPNRLHDFRRPKLLSDDRLNALDTVHRKLARSLAESLSALARAKVSVEVAGLRQRAYFEFIRSLPNPTSLFLVYFLPPGTPCVLEIGPGILFPLLERLLGGRGGEAATVPARPMTRIEQGVAKTIASHFLKALGECWRSALSPGWSHASSDAAERVDDLRFDVAEVEHNPLLMQVVGPSEPALVLSLAVTLGPGSPAAGPRDGVCHLCLPSKPFEAFLARLARAAVPSPHGEHNGPEERGRILEQLSAAEVELTAELASVPLALPDLLSLRPGDMVELPSSRAGESGILVEGRRVFRGQAAEQDGHRVLRIQPSEPAE